MPSSRVLVATTTQSRASANACSLRRRSSADSDECDTNVVISRARSAMASCSAWARESQNASRFSPPCSAAMTFAALTTEPT